jgi:hypothetical protein
LGAIGRRQPWKATLTTPSRPAIPPFLRECRNEPQKNSALTSSGTKHKELFAIRTRRNTTAFFLRQLHRPAHKSYRTSGNKPLAGLSASFLTLPSPSPLKRKSPNGSLLRRATARLSCLEVAQAAFRAPGSGVSRAREFNQSSLRMRSRSARKKSTRELLWPSVAPASRRILSIRMLARRGTAVRRFDFAPNNTSGSWLLP